jgi:hypothetical protein
MQAHEIVILAVTLTMIAAFVGLMLWDGFRARWPKGIRQETKWGDGRYLCHVIHSPGLGTKWSGSPASSRAAKAVWAAGSAWRSARAIGRVAKDDSEISEVIILFVEAQHMLDRVKAVNAQQGTSYRTLAGYIDRHHTRKWKGRDIPMAVISEECFDGMFKTGEPVIHEVLHALARDYHGDAADHANPMIWAQSAHLAEGTCVQDLAQSLYAETKS